MSQKSTDFHYGISINAQMVEPSFDLKFYCAGNKTSSWSFDLEAQYDITPNLQLNSGILLNRLKLETRDYSLFFDCDISSPTPIELNSWLEEQFNIYYIGLPLSLKYKIIGQSNHLYGRAGLQGLFKISKNQSSRIHECGASTGSYNSDAENTPSNFIFSANAGVGFEFAITKNYKIFIEPIFSYSLTEPLQNFGIHPKLSNKAKLISKGIRIGLIL